MEIGEIVERPDYAVFKCAGAYGIESFMEAVNAAIRHSINLGNKSLLLDVRGVAGGPLDTFHRFDIGERIAAAQRSHSKVVAIAVLGSEPLLEAERFGEKVAVNRGAVGKVFFDAGEAEAWLEQRKAP